MLVPVPMVVECKQECIYILALQYESAREQGGIVNFNLLDSTGEYVGFAAFNREINERTNHIS